MNILVKKGNLADFAVESAVVTHFEGETVLGGAAAKLDKKTGGVIAGIIASGDFTGRLHGLSMVYSRGTNPQVKRVLVVGLGKRSEFSLDRLRGAYARAAQHIRSLNLSAFSTSIDFGSLDIPLEQLTEAVVEGVQLGLYQFSPFKTVERQDIREISEFTIAEGDEAAFRVIKGAAKTAEIIADATIFARDMVSAPPNEMTPTDLANEAKDMAKGKNIKVKLIETDEMKQLGMNALLAVAAGSDEPPLLIVLEYNGGKKSSPFIALVGKGVTFDSGGISIKPAENMDKMKSDMAGGAAVIAAVKAAAELGLPVNLVGLIPATENLPSGKAYKPGDILKSLSGLTIEIVTTDAEGRLILADALTYAGRYKPAVIIDVATLTGACVVALGDHVIGMMGTDDELKDEIRAAANVTGEMVWELPLWEEYHEMIKGDAADYKNASGRAGGAITAGAFLSKFAGDYPWVHLDIAGPAWLEKEKPYIPKGASGVGVRLLVQFLRNWYRAGKKMN